MDQVVSLWQTASGVHTAGVYSLSNGEYVFLTLSRARCSTRGQLSQHRLSVPSQMMRVSPWKGEMAFPFQA
eukprot:s3145_g4.t1